MGKSGSAISTSSSNISGNSHKKKDHKHRSKQDSDDSENELESSAYEKELLAIKEEQKKRKEYLKAVETPEEKRARRLAKKEAKERKRQMITGVDGLGYTNSSNPFGDAQLTENFVWHKKMEKEGVTKLNSYEQRKRQKEKMEEMCIELEKVKKRREDREREKLARDEEMTLIQRQKEAAMFSQWAKQEDDFHLHQARLRSTIRIHDGRAKPIDLLAAYINPEEENLEIQMHEPYAALVGLSIDDLEDLLEDIKVYVSIDQKKNVEFWEDITIMVEDELNKLKKKVEQADNVAKRRDVINAAVHTDVHGIFRGKTYSQLIALQKQIKAKITSGGSIDVGYWEALLQQLKAFMAKARLKERHQQFLKSKLTELKMESTVPGLPAQLPGSEHLEEPTQSPLTSHEPDAFGASEKEKEGEDKPASDLKFEVDEELSEKMELQRIAEADSRGRAMDAYNVGSFSPKLIPFGDIEEEKWTDCTEDMRKLEYLREQVKKGSTVEEEEEADNLFNKEMLRGMNENEEAFNVPVPVSSKKYLWSDKYRPRKPRFFNRVHTGYEWNKYNQTHYDTDNPPPKIVQGYKFNIFYPDLIDKTVTPRYTLTPCDDDPDFAILRFSAGPPYEDIAFKVVDREWEYSHRHGFRCQFYNNIFQLYFHFKRYRYRR